LAARQTELRRERETAVSHILVLVDHYDFISSVALQAPRAVYVAGYVADRLHGDVFTMANAGTKHSFCSVH
jgi:hypothetical protein